MFETRKRLIAVCTDMMLETRKRLIAVCTDDLAWHPDSCYPVVVIVLEIFKRGSFAPHQQNRNEWRYR